MVPTSVLVVGGGRIALRKVKTLLPTGAHITVVAPQLDPEFTTIPSIVLKSRPYEPLDLRGIFMVFICTDKPAVNAQVNNDARARRILVNNACDYLDGDFIVPARMDFGENTPSTLIVSFEGAQERVMNTLSLDISLNATKR